MSTAGRWWLVGFVAVMLAIPTSALLSEDERVAFGWQMYSSMDGITSYEIERNGERETLELSEWTVSSRRELDAREHLAPHVCERESGATAVWSITERLPDLETVKERHPCQG